MSSLNERQNSLSRKGPLRGTLTIPSEREKMESWSLGQITDYMSNAECGSNAHTRASAEILRRQTILQQEATAAQQRAADATIETAKFTHLNARYMLLSVIALVITSVLSLINGYFLN